MECGGREVIESDRLRDLALPRRPGLRRAVLWLTLVAVVVSCIMMFHALVHRESSTRTQLVPAWYSPGQIPSSLRAEHDKAGVWTFNVVSATRDGQMLPQSYAWGVADGHGKSLLYLCDIDGTAGLKAAWLGRKDSWARVHVSRLIALTDVDPPEILELGGNYLRRCAVLDRTDARVMAAMRRVYLLPRGN